MSSRKMNPTQILYSISQCMCNDGDEEISFSRCRPRRNRQHNEILELDELLEDYQQGKKSANAIKSSKESRISKYVNALQAHHRMAKYHLTNNDGLVAANMWSRMSANKVCNIEWEEVLCWCKLDKSEVRSALLYLASLLDRNILSNERGWESDYHLYPFSLMEGSYTLHSRFCYDLLNHDVAEMLESYLSKGWDNESQMQHDITTGLQILRECCPELEEDRNDRLGYHFDFFSEFIRPLLDRLKTGSREIPMVRLAWEQDLSDREAIALLWAYESKLLKSSASITLVRNLISADLKDRMENNRFPESNSKMKDLGLCATHGRRFGERNGCLGMTTKLGTMLGLKDDDDKDDEDCPAVSECLTEITATQSFDDLILPAEDKELLTAAINCYLRQSHGDLTDWGLNLSMGNGEGGSKGTCILLYGEPGTGKTFSAGAIANALGRRLMAIDASQLRNKYYGESEKILRRSFAEMRRLAINPEMAPIFLLNEADQIIHKRSTQEHSCSSVENAIQNIFLEELETFPGILILTTNLVENIDDAYFRRFDVKIELHRPDEDCRLRLWQLHLPASIPGAAEIDRDYLARTFALTGGQIALVVHNACRKAIARPETERKLLLTDLISYATLEDPWGGTTDRNNRIGF